MSSRGFESAISFLQNPSAEWNGGSSGLIELPWAMTPEKYLSYARSDLRQGSTRGRVNALGNAKRALHCQIDSVLYCTGFFDRAQERNWPFPIKLDVLNDLKIVTPKVLSRINQHRNEIEHEYVVPDDEQDLGDFIDVVEIFVAALRPLARSRHESLGFLIPNQRNARELEVNLVAMGELRILFFGHGRQRPLRVHSYGQFRKMQAAIYRVLARHPSFPAF